MSNTSATGGYLLPAADAPLPGNLTFEQFLQTVLVGVSGLPGDLVRPKWQIQPPAQPDITVDWLAFGLAEDDADTFAYNDTDSAGNNVFQRMEALTLQCTFYGPNSLTFMKLVRDGFQIPQNMEALESADMVFAYTGKATRVPDLVNERWVDRWEMSVVLRREVLRVYPILTFLTGAGTLNVNNSNGEKSIAITVSE